MSIVETAIYRVSCLNRTVLGAAQPRHRAKTKVLTRVRIPFCQLSLLSSAFPDKPPI
ncbi:MAG: hypothetical protein V7K67_19590 [Nostoc sp.]|uniref:hypothetical protein n=1 Tax=Nostoc sp. TaxID=1180 RepID=UPI002FFAD31D